MCCYRSWRGQLWVLIIAMYYSTVHLQRGSDGRAPPNGYLKSPPPIMCCLKKYHVIIFLRAKHIWRFIRGSLVRLAFLLW